MSETPSPTPAKPTAPTPPSVPTKPVAPRPVAPKPGEPSPNAPRPGVIFGGIATLKVEDIVVPFEYQVRTGETVELIAQTMYGSRKKASIIREANTALGASGQPSVGQSLKIPKA